MSSEIQLGRVKLKNLAADCPTCGGSCLPYEVNVVDFDDVYCRYECIGETVCEVCHGEPGPCERCGGTGKMPCTTHYGADGEKSSWVE
jgi:hypothetical protein